MTMKSYLSKNIFNIYYKLFAFVTSLLAVVFCSFSIPKSDQKSSIIQEDWFYKQICSSVKEGLHDLALEKQ